MPASRNSRETLHTLNALLALANGSDRELVRHIHAAIDFEADTSPGGADTLVKALPRLLALHQFDHEDGAFQHLPLEQGSLDSLWLRSALLEALRRTAGNRHALILITGLKAAVCGEPGRWTPSRRQRYKRLVASLEAMAAAHTAESTRLTLLFL
jgi:hypothetical protein